MTASSTRTTDRHPGAIIRTSIVAADSLRRRRDATRQVWQMAPVVAGIGLAFAVAARWGGWSRLLVFAVLALGAAALVAYAWIRGRALGMSDPMADRVDQDAQLHGELRSAAWFVDRVTSDPWVGLHLDRAAARAEKVDWKGLYPAVQARRAQIAAGVMVAATLVLSATLPERFGFRPEGAAIRETREAIPPDRLAELLPPELLKQLEALLAAAESANASPAQRAASAAELRALLAQLSQIKDAESLKALARTLDPNASKTALSAKDLKSLAERAKRTAEMASLSPEVRKALEKLSENLEDASDAAAGPPQDPQGAMASKESQRGEAAQSTGKSDVDAASIQSVKEASAGAGAGVIMMSNEEAAMGGEPGLGVGGGSAPNNGGGQMAAIAQALKKETVEASTDTAGDNVLTDIRRKTEESAATVGFAKSASRSFDRSRAAAPPPVPEARRQGVQTYFIRKQ
jgi:hypothetical protein